MKTLLPLLCLLLFPSAIPAAEIALLVIDNDSYLAQLSASALPEELSRHVRVVSAGELERGGEELRRDLDEARVLIVDVMGRELEDYVASQLDLGGKTVYALRGSSDDEALKRKGFLFDEELSSYFRHLSRDNVDNLLRFAIHRHLDARVTYSAVQPLPQLGIYHPAAPCTFATIDHYRRWQEAQPGYAPGRPRLALLFYSALLSPGQKEPLDTLITRLERSGFAVTACFGDERLAIEQFLLPGPPASRVELLLALSLKFSSALTPELLAALRRLDVPLISAIGLYRDTVQQWRQSPQGIGAEEVAWTMAVPETSGLIEPTVLLAKERVEDEASGKTWFLGAPVTENIERLLPRLHAWVNLQRKASHDKRIAILFYNHHQGKQNVGASYLNVFASLEEIFARLAKDGYQVGTLPTEAEIKKLILGGARNVGSWAPGEVEAMVRAGHAVLLDPDLYRQWFDELPGEFRDRVVAQWGPPDSSTIMRHEGHLVIPVVRRGQVAMLPEPARGLSDDAMKLYHDTSIYPHHQYIAAYLWIHKVFAADAIIHLGTHATYEWTPGKQNGLSPSCSPEVLTGHIPNLYPYIVDDVGEALQAKRRGRGVILSHLTPMLRQSGLYQEYGRMAELAGEITQGTALGSAAVPEKQAELMALAEASGILADLRGRGSLAADGKALAETLGHYLEEVKEELIPYGMHTYGRVKGTEELAEMAAAAVVWHKEMKPQEVVDGLKLSARLEIDNLLRGLRGRYIEPGEGNDPLRNPAALPTGRNLYGFNAARLPSPAAWKLGRDAAEQILASHAANHGRPPEKVAVLLWAVESLRNEGVNECTILALLGIRPRWTPTGKVAGLEVIPRGELGRPRIDVLVNASGLYRDLFPDKLRLLDEAVQLAIRQSDVDNLVAAGSGKLRQRLLASGMAEEEAEELSRLRVFSEEPGSYGNGVSEMAGASGLWRDEAEVVDVFEKRSGFAYGGGHWGRPSRELLGHSLATVEATVHSRSSSVYGVLDNDDMFQYLGGLAMAVRQRSGQAPQTLVADQRAGGEVRVEDLAATLGREMRSRYLNPRWIAGMKGEDYAGAREMSNFVEYLWGWQVTTPDKVDGDRWRQVYEVYVEDRHGMELAEFFDRANPWAYQSLTARMLEAVRKGYWQADEAVQRRLAVEYAVNVVEKGVACCDHTCNNPLLNQMVVSIISLPGVLGAETVERFKLAVEQAGGETLAEQVERREDLQRRLTAPGGQRALSASAEAETAHSPARAEEVSGLRMERMTTSDETTEVTSSGVQWLAMLLVLAIVGLAAWGMGRATTHMQE